jgi:hypothetical protein
MSRHHFIPGSILRLFASSEAWRLVRHTTKETKKTISISDQKVLTVGQPRHWPLCVYDKHANIFERRLLGKVCSSADFYALSNYEDPVLRGIIRQNFQAFENPSSFTPLTEDQLSILGKEPLDTNIIEQLALASIDGEFAQLIDPLRTGKEISKEDIDLILRFVSLSRYRSPAWRSTYSVIVEQDIKRKFKPLLEKMIKSSKGESPPKITNKKFLSEYEKSFYVMAIYQSCMKQVTGWHEVDARILIMHAPGRIKFIVSDNPARTYYPDRLKYISVDRLPGIIEEESQIAFPIAPDTCIIVTANRNYPKFSYHEATATEVKKINTALAIIARDEIVFPDPYIYMFEPWLDLANIQPLRNP